MIITKCPVRVSLAGGGSDLESYINEHGRGSVINFPINIYTYIALHRDIIGYNTYCNKYLMNYSKREEANSIEDIKNDVIRVAFEHFNIKPCLISMVGDIFSSGSGLAVSSSYMIALIKAVEESLGISTSNYEIAKLAMTLERKFNFLLGYQDTYGCAGGSLKMMDFKKGKDPKISYLASDLLNTFDMHLMFTGVSRSSTKILSTIENFDYSLLELTDKMQECLETNNREMFINTIKEGWAVKKGSSPDIISNYSVKSMDLNLEKDKDVLCHRLCGAGNGGFFLIFTDPQSELTKKYKFCKKININHTGVTTVLGN